jgi:type VI secretion system protein ImpE
MLFSSLVLSPDFACALLRQMSKLGFVGLGVAPFGQLAFQTYLPRRSRLSATGTGWSRLPQEIFMTVANELYEAGQLDQAIEAGLKEVKAKPLDVTARYRLILLMCYNGELERADRQLTILSTQNPDAAIGAALLRQLIRAELARSEFHSQGRVPEFIGEPNELMKMHLKASIYLREGATAEAADLLLEAEQQRTELAGTCDGQNFDDLRDLDDLFAPILEALTSTGKYFWIPLSDVTSLEFQSPESLADLMWRPMRMTVQNEPPGAVYLPTLYVGSSKEDDELIRLGRSTKWLGLEEPPVRGLGLRMWLIGDESKSILDISQLDFNREMVSAESTGSDD